MAIGEKLSCEIIDLANDGRGIGRVNGKAYFVEGAVSYTHLTLPTILLV